MPRAIYLFVPLAAVALLILHTLKVRGTLVDTTTLGLLALLLLVPLAPYVTRLRAWEFEAEIGRGEARELQAAAAELPPGPAPSDIAPSEAPTVQELIARSAARTGKTQD